MQFTADDRFRYTSGNVLHLPISVTDTALEIIGSMNHEESAKFSVAVKLFVLFLNL